MDDIKVRKKVVPLWLIVVLLVTGITVPMLAYLWQSVTMPFEVREPLEIISYPSEFSLFPGETAEFNVTLQNHASINYSVIFDYKLNDTYYQVNYVRFSEEEYIVVPGLQTLNAWLFVEPNAPPTQASLTINFVRIKPITSTVDWTCSLHFHNETFIVTVDVNLADGMNRDEAVKVATKVFNVTMGQNMLHQFRSAKEDEKGIWTIEFTWGYSIQDLGHWFEAVIDPFNQTVVYDSCK